MDVRYPAYCLAHPRYYESPEHAAAAGGHVDFSHVVDLPSGWARLTDGQWTHCRPPGADDAGLPSQGWKIHVSVTLENAAEILKIVSAYCAGRGLVFKHLANRVVLLARNAKYAPRESSGKFITIYPVDVEELGSVLHGLDHELGGMPGPYILSDLKWRDGPLYVRYGAFVRRYTYSTEGAMIPAVERPDGQLVADHREPRFIVPEWVAVPEILASAAASRTGAVQPEEFPYDILEALHFSNGGGVYSARRRSDGAALILKEGRPHAGLDLGGRDAVTRLSGEYAVLSALRDVPGVPQVYDHRRLGGHEFLAMEHVPGISLHTWLTKNYLNLRAADDRVGLRDYQASVQHIMDQVERTLRAIHRHGYTFNDLHPGNIMVDDEQNVSLIDFEAATSVGEQRRLGAPGFAAPDHVQGVEADLYSLNAVRLFLYVPLSSLLSLCPAKATALVVRAEHRLDLNQETVETLTRALTVTDTRDPDLRPAGPEFGFPPASGVWDRHLAALTASIRASATPDRHDRLFPGDINQFLHGGGGVAFGAAGVVAALYAAGCTDLDGYVQWLLADARANRHARFGLYDGTAGICHVLSELGHANAAATLFHGFTGAFRSVRGVKLFDGQAGIGLTSLDLHRRTGERCYLDQAEHAANLVENAIFEGAFTIGTGSASPQAVQRDRRGNAVENFYGGLLYGWSGLALFMVRMYEVTGDERWLRLGLTAAHRDLDLCETLGDGTLQMRNHARLLPYLATGSAGVAIVNDLLLRYAPDDRLAAAIPALSLACAADFCIGSGLFNGRVGLVYALRRLASRLDWPDLTAQIDAGLQSLDLFALADEHGLVFPGEQNLRVSMDLATGSAGVLRLVSVLAGRTTEILPFLGPDRWTPVPG